MLNRDGGPINREVLELMSGRLIHRGPDSEGVEVFGSVGLAHRRLSVIDLSANGRQPMSNEDGSLWITYNGEVYNFECLRADLIKQGHVFRSRTDTEVVVHLYEQEGLAGLAKLNGQFAFALWDEHNKRLVLGRDRTGQKPLYVYEKGPIVAFASELKALYAHPAFDQDIDPTAIPRFLAHGYVPGPATFHRHVTKLEPGTLRLFEARGDRTVRYWSFPATMANGPAPAEAAREVRTRVEEAVRRRLVADVPIGAFLSGGIDSSVVVAAMVRQAEGRVRTFSLGFDGDPRFDESRYARRVAEFLGTDHVELRVGPDSFQMLPQLLEHLDEPFGDSSIIPTAIISRLAREHTTVALTGDGGDELFAGYRRFMTTAYVERVPRVLRLALAQVSAMAPASAHRTDAFASKALRFASRMAPPLRERLHEWIAMFPPELLKELLVEPGEASSPVRTAVQANRDDVINQLLRVNAQTYLVEDLNVKVDRASMAYSLETRSPFLDVELMRYAFALPGRYKIRFGQMKWILRQAFADALPQWVFTRRKMGFGLPLGAWFRGPLRPLIDEHLRPREAHIYRWLRRASVMSLVDAHAAGRRDYGHQLWALLSLELWLQRIGHSQRQRPMTCMERPPT